MAWVGHGVVRHGVVRYGLGRAWRGVAIDWLLHNKGSYLEKTWWSLVVRIHNLRRPNWDMKFKLKKATRIPSIQIPISPWSRLTCFSGSHFADKICIITYFQKAKCVSKSLWSIPVKIFWFDRMHLRKWATKYIAYQWVTRNYYRLN